MATLTRLAGSYTIAVQYLDFRHGVSTYTAFLNNKIITTWRAGNTLPGDSINGHTSTRFTLFPVVLHPGDALKVEGRPNGGEPAPIDSPGDHFRFFQQQAGVYEDY